MARRTYTLEDIEAGLHALAVSAGNASEAHRVLKVQKRDIPATTLRDWIKTHDERYQEIRRGAIGQVAAKLEADMADTVSELHELEREYLTATRKALKNQYVCSMCDYSCERPATKERRCPQCENKLIYSRTDPEKLAKAMYNVAQAFGLMNDKLRVRQMQPTEIVGVQNGDDELRKILSDSSFAGLFVDGTADDVTPTLTTTNGNGHAATT